MGLKLLLYFVLFIALCEMGTPAMGGASVGYNEGLMGLFNLAKGSY